MICLDEDQILPLRERAYRYTLVRPVRKMPIREQAKLGTLAYNFAIQALTGLESEGYHLSKWQLDLCEGTTEVVWTGVRGKELKNAWMVNADLRFISDISVDGMRFGKSIFVCIAPWFSTLADHAKVTGAESGWFVISPLGETIDLERWRRYFNHEGLEITYREFMVEPVYMVRDW